MWKWIIGGLSTNDPTPVLDDARLHAGILVLSYIAVACYTVYHTPPTTFAEAGSFLKDFGIGAAAMAGGIGGWFKLRGTN